jgi:bis(5'-nucleosidyl)-tetraphosphatase
MAKLQSAGVIVIRFENNNPYFLLLRSFDFWDFPKGKIEGDESKIQAAIREVKEESGIDDLSFDWGRAYYETETFGRDKKVVYYFMAKTNSKNVQLEKNPITGLKEHEEYKWVSFDEAKDLTRYRINRAINWAMDRIKAFQ